MGTVLFFVQIFMQIIRLKQHRTRDRRIEYTIVYKKERRTGICVCQGLWLA